MDFPPNF
jgi:hypothetical protein